MPLGQRKANRALPPVTLIAVVVEGGVYYRVQLDPRCMKAANFQLFTAENIEAIKAAAARKGN